MKECLPNTLEVKKINGIPFIKMKYSNEPNIQYLTDLSKRGKLIMVSHRHSRSVDPITRYPTANTFGILKSVFKKNHACYIWFDELFFPKKLSYQERAYLFPERWLLYYTSKQVIIIEEFDINRLWISAELLMIYNSMNSKSSDRLIYCSIEFDKHRIKDLLLYKCLKIMTSKDVELIKLPPLAESPSFLDVWELVKKLISRTTISLTDIECKEKEDLLWVVVSIYFVLASINSNISLESNLIRNLISQYQEIIKKEYEGRNGKIGWFFNWKMRWRLPWTWADAVFERCVEGDLHFHPGADISKSAYDMMALEGGGPFSKFDHVYAEKVALEIINNKAKAYKKSQDDWISV